VLLFKLLPAQLHHYFPHYTRSSYSACMNVVVSSEIIPQKIC